MTYVEAIRQAIDDALAVHPDLSVLGQGLWSPFYVGRSMDGLDEKYGRDRVIDTPVSENAVTGIALGIAAAGGRALVVHPRMDFMVLAMDQVVNEAAKWRYVLGSASPLHLTIRGIINRGGEQGAQHSQALHSWFAHIPGLRVVMPARPRDAYTLLRQSLECPDPVVFVEDRWSYSETEAFDRPNQLPPLADERPQVVRGGSDVTLVGIGHTTNTCLSAAQTLASDDVECEVIDLRVLNPLDAEVVCRSTARTGRLVVVDGGWRTAGMAGEVVARVAESSSVGWKKAPIRVTLPDAPAPSSRVLEALYYPSEQTVCDAVRKLMGAGR